MRSFLHSALSVDDLAGLYEQARLQYGHLELSQGILSVLKVKLTLAERDLQSFPKTGPVIVVANHPFGLLDGMLLDSILLRVRPDIKILTNSLICSVEELRHRCLPIDVFETGDARENNVKSLRKLAKLLRSGGGAALFPAGEVSHWRSDIREISDPAWSTAAARYAQGLRVPVVPIYFDGANSLSFQLAGVVHPRLRTASLLRELMKMRNRCVEARIGRLIQPEDLDRFDTVEAATDYLRARVYVLRHRQVRPTHAQPAPPRASFPSSKTRVAVTESNNTVTRIAELIDTRHSVVENEDYVVVRAAGSEIPDLLDEVGSLREVTFRAAGEGTGHARDLDRFDPHYQHLLLWHKERKQIAGSYRLAWTADIFRQKGIAGLYTSTLFRYQPAFFQKTGPALELGRSFIRLEYQKEYAPLLLLWQAIARSAAERPEAPVLFGAVSVSNQYSEASRSLIVRFILNHGYWPDLASLVTPRKPVRSHLTAGFEVQTIARCLDDIETLSQSIAEIEGGAGVPVLLRQYFKLGGRVAGFNVDRRFSNALDGLLIVDLRQTSSKVLGRYMGADRLAAFRRYWDRPHSA